MAKFADKSREKPMGKTGMKARTSMKHINFRRWLLGVLLVITFAMMVMRGGNAFYANSIYPVIGSLLANASSWIPFSIGEVFVMVSIVWVVCYPIYALVHPKRKFLKACGNVLEYLLWVLVWFYWAWGLNYGQPNYYERTNTKPVAIDKQAFSRFAHHYVEVLNSNYTVVEAKDEKKVKENVMAAYKQHGFNRIRVVNPQVKTMLYTPLASMVGVTGSMAPFFCEFTINGDLLPHDYAASYAHEYAHLQGITSEGEANFYAYLATTQSMDKGVRFSGYYSILGHVFNNARVLMNSDDYFALYERLRPEIKEMIESDRAYWQERYSDLIGEVQEYLYNLYLKYHGMPEGIKNYSEVIGLIMATENI